MFSVKVWKNPQVTGKDGTMVDLVAPDGSKATIFPALGFNCFSWQVASSEGSLDILHQDSDLFPDGKPTRSGIPILFPIPNRVRAGKFHWNGKDYQLPLNDHIQQNHIHGFAVRSAFRVVNQGFDANSAFVTGEFQLSKDATNLLPCWPADCILRLTYRLRNRALALEAEVTNPDSKPLPFGLGYHPYFKLPFIKGLDAEDCALSCAANSFWHLDECLPDGRKHPMDAQRNLNTLRKLRGFSVDDVLTDLPAFHADASGLMERGRVQGSTGHAMTLNADGCWREMVVFTPGSRNTVCIEPYTCMTDAINLQQKGVDAGLIVLPPGAVHFSQVELRIVETPKA
ncbi:MAG: aldose 1-epimerase [Gemmataceae bacterium]